MMHTLKLFTLAGLFLLSSSAHAQKSNAAPSQHLRYIFASDDAVLKMQQVKIVSSAYTTYFSVFNWAGGYAGLQQTPDSSSGASKILIASQWDPNTAGGILARPDYLGKNTKYSRFGGEGDGAKTINPFNWQLNTWYNFVIRSWKANDQLFIATFIQDRSTLKWFHTSTLVIPARAQYLGSRSGAFLENWVGENPKWDGRFERKAFFKDCWNMTEKGNWEKSTSRFFSANSNDAKRNGKYDRSFNAGYDAKEDAYFMEHGGTVQPAEAFGTGRRLDLPEQTGQGTAPVLVTGEIKKVTASRKGKETIISWEVDDTKSPQLSYTVEISNPAGKIVQQVSDTVPQKREVVMNLPKGKYTVKVSMTDIFGGAAAPVTTTLSK